jgi:hypothetical protein
MNELATPTQADKRPPRDPEEAQRALVRVQALLERQRRVESLVQREQSNRDKVIESRPLPPMIRRRWSSSWCIASTCPS